MYPNLNAEMARRGITRNALAKILKKTPTTIGLKLNGKYQLKFAECLAIRNAIDKDLQLEYLFKEEGENSEATCYDARTGSRTIKDDTADN